MHRDCNLLLFDFDLTAINYAIIVRPDYPHLKRLRLAFSLLSTTDLYDRMLRKYALLEGKTIPCEPLDLSGNPLGVYQVADAMWILCFFAVVGIFVLFVERRWKLKQNRKVPQNDRKFFKVFKTEKFVLRPRSRSCSI